MLYLTPDRFREMGFGIDVSELSDTELTSLAYQATAVANAYCNVPRIPQQHDFRGGTITNEEHAWRIPVHTTDIGQRRFYPFHWPIVSVEQFRIYVTNTQYVEIGSSELFVNNSERYLEVVSLAITSVGLFGALIIPNIGLATPVARCNYTYGWDLTSTEESLSTTDGQTWRAQNQFWHSTPAPAVKKNGVAQSTGFTIDYTEGMVVFDTNLTATDTVTATYHHKLPQEIQYGTGHIMAHLHGQAELHSRGMAHLRRLRIAEVEMETQNLPSRGEVKSLSQNLDILVPEAALLLGSFAADNLTVR